MVDFIKITPNEKHTHNIHVNGEWSLYRHSYVYFDGVVYTQHTTHNSFTRATTIANGRIVCIYTYIFTSH